MRKQTTKWMVAHGGSPSGRTRYSVFRLSGSGRQQSAEFLTTTSGRQARFWLRSAAESKAAQLNAKRED